MFPFPSPLLTVALSGSALPSYLGTQDVGGGTSTASADRIRLLKVTAPAAGQINSISFISGENDASARQRAVVYSDSAGSPNSLLAQSGENIGITNGTTHTLNLTSPYSFANGEVMWFGFHFGNSTATIYTTISPSLYSSNTSQTDSYSDGPASTHVGVFSSISRDWTFWANVS